ncbi:MAG: hypothetical protein ACE5GV_15610 [Candidatus Scalindua sp.]
MSIVNLKQLQYTNQSMICHLPFFRLLLNIKWDYISFISERFQSKLPVCTPRVDRLEFL